MCTKLSTFFANFVDNSVDYSEFFAILVSYNLSARVQKCAYFCVIFIVKTPLSFTCRHTPSFSGIYFREVTAMISFSEVKGLDVLSKIDCSIVGRIENAFFDEYCKKIAYFVTSGDNPRLIPPAEIKRFADVAVVEDAVSILNLEDADLTALVGAVGKTVYTPFGVSKGEIIDCFFDEKGKVATFRTSSGEISPAEIRGVGDVVVLKENRKSRKRKVDFSSFAAEDAPVSIQAETDKDGGAVIPAPTVSIAVGGDFTPPRIIGDYNFLLGRTLSADLLTYSGDLIAPANSFVTIDVVEKARANGKLLDLTLNSK